MALALKQGGFDWSMLAYAVSFGGSMVGGSSAGAFISNLLPEGRSIAAWILGRWCVPATHDVGFFAQLWTLGWQPS